MRNKKKPGSQILLKLKDNESQHVVDWFNCQETIAESIRYLIEKDIVENGVRDVGEEIRNSFTYFNKQVISKPTNQYIPHSIESELKPNISNQLIEGKESRVENDSIHPIQINNETLGEEYNQLDEKEKKILVNTKEEVETEDHATESVNKKEEPATIGIEESTNASFDLDDMNIFG